MDTRVILLRFALALGGSLAFGLARQRLGKPIGFGTFTLLAVGACALAMAAVRCNPENPLPLLGAIVTGIGFLGAGALFRTGERVVGFTSSATIWVFAVLGLLIGIGEYVAAGLVYAAIWIIVLIEQRLESRWIGAHQRKLIVELQKGVSEEDLRALGLPPRANAQALRVEADQDTLVLTYLIRRPRGDSEGLLERLERSPLVHRISVDSI